MTTIDQALEQANDPELTEAVNNLLLQFNLLLMADAIGPGQVTSSQAEQRAHQIAAENADGDSDLEGWLFNICMADWRNRR